MVKHLSLLPMLLQTDISQDRADEKESMVRDEVEELSEHVWRTSHRNGQSHNLKSQIKISGRGADEQ